MSIQDSIVGLIEVEVPEGRNLASVVDSLVRDPEPQPRAVMCVVRSGKPNNRGPEPNTAIAVLADLPRLQASLSSEFQVVLDRLRNVS